MDCAFVHFQPQSGASGDFPSARPMIQNDGGQQTWSCVESAWLQDQQQQVPQLQSLGAACFDRQAPPVEPCPVPVIFVQGAYEPTVEAPMNPMYSSVTPQQYEDLHQLKFQYQQQQQQLPYNEPKQQHEGSWQFIASKRQRVMEPLCQPTWLMPGAQGITAGGAPSSRFHGVTWYKASRRWQARLCTGRKQIHLGYYKVEQDAARAYDLACLQHPGTRLSQLNFPEEAAAILKGTAGPPDASRLVLMARVHEAFKAAGASTPGRMLGNGLHAAIAQLEQQMILNPFRLGSDAALHTMSEGDTQHVIKTHTSGEQLSNGSQQQQQQSSPSSGNSERQPLSPRVLLPGAEVGRPLQSPPGAGRADTVGQADSVAHPVCATAAQVPPAPAAVEVLHAAAAAHAIPIQQSADQPPLAPAEALGSPSPCEPQATPAQAASVMLPVPAQMPMPVQVTTPVQVPVLVQGQPAPLTATHELLRQAGQPVAPEMLTPQTSGASVPLGATGMLQVYEHVWDGTKLVLKSVVVGVMSSPLPSV